MYVVDGLENGHCPLLHSASATAGVSAGPGHGTGEGHGL